MQWGSYHASIARSVTKGKSHAARMNFFIGGGGWLVGDMAWCAAPRLSLPIVPCCWKFITYKVPPASTAGPSMPEVYSPDDVSWRLSNNDGSPAAQPGTRDESRKDRPSRAPALRTRPLYCNVVCVRSSHIMGLDLKPFTFVR